MGLLQAADEAKPVQVPLAVFRARSSHARGTEQALLDVIPDRARGYARAVGQLGEVIDLRVVKHGADLTVLRRTVKTHCLRREVAIDPAVRRKVDGPEKLTPPRGRTTKIRAMYMRLIASMRPRLAARCDSELEPPTSHGDGVIDGRPQGCTIRSHLCL